MLGMYEKSVDLTIPASGRIMLPAVTITGTVTIGAVPTNCAPVAITRGGAQDARSGHILSPVADEGPGLRNHVVIRGVADLSDLWLVGQPGDSVICRYMLASDGKAVENASASS